LGSWQAGLVEMTRVLSQSGIKCRGIVFARSKLEAVRKAFKKAHRGYPESEGYSNHQAVALEVTHDFLDLAHKLSPLPKKDKRRGEHAIMGEAVETEEEISIDVDTDM
jgi:hypothetical protein